MHDVDHEFGFVFIDIETYFVVAMYMWKSWSANWPIFFFCFKATLIYL